MAKGAAVGAAAALDVSSPGIGFAIYRYEAKDAKAFNVGLYSVYADLPSRYDLNPSWPQPLPRLSPESLNS